MSANGPDDTEVIVRSAKRRRGESCSLQQGMREQGMWKRDFEDTERGRKRSERKREREKETEEKDGTVRGKKRQKQQNGTERRRTVRIAERKHRRNGRQAARRKGKTERCGERLFKRRRQEEPYGQQSLHGLSLGEPWRPGKQEIDSFRIRPAVRRIEEGAYREPSGDDNRKYAGNREYAVGETIGYADPCSGRMTEESLRQFERHLRQEGKKASTVEKYLRDVKAFWFWLRETEKESEENAEEACGGGEERLGTDPNSGGEGGKCGKDVVSGTGEAVEENTGGLFGSAAVTKAKAWRWRDVLCEKGYAPVTVNTMLTALNLFFPFPGQGGLSGEDAADSEEIFPQFRAGALSQRIRAAGPGCEREGKTAVGAADRDDGSHRHPGQRSEVYNSGGGPAEQSGDRAERKDPHDSDSGSAEKEAAAVCGRKGISSGEIFITKSGKGISASRSGRR